MTTLIGDTGRRLPSPEALAFAVAVIAIALTPVWGPLQLLVPLAVLGPSLLREVGLLRDGDEYGRGVAHRAGFHALLVSALLVFASFASGGLGAWRLHPDVLTGETLRKVMLLTFLVSFLLQYWGAREGSFRILLGLAAVTAAMTVGLLLRMEDDRLVVGPVMAGVVVAEVALAFGARRWPRAVALVLAAVCLLMVGDAVRHAVRPAYAVRGLPAIVLQAFIVPGAMAVALLRRPDTED